MPALTSPVPERFRFLTALQLKLYAILTMFMDHAWATIAVSHRWLTAVGRLAFPVFAFQLVEGFFHTSSPRKYLTRMFLWALAAEIPFNLMASGGSPIYPFHQNVLFTFCEGLLLMLLLEKARKKGTGWFILAGVLCTAGGFILGTLTFVDYNGYGILMILLFYFTRTVRFGWILQLAGMFYINWELIGGLVYPVTLFGMDIDIPQQAIACLSLIPIWLYSGRKGFSSRAVQTACYAFYPAHILVLSLLMLAGVSI